jgi:hypothetical protein
MADKVVTAVRCWVETLVVAMNLCPFAKRELDNNRVRFTVTPATTQEQLLAALQAELQLLDTDQTIETTLLIHPAVLQDFFDYNQFLGSAERLLQQLGLTGVYQIASFHPHYQFNDTAVNAAENYTNRSPYPLLHILREESLERAIDNHPNVEGIPVRNIAQMNSLGEDKLREIMQACLNPTKSDNNA